MLAGSAAWRTACVDRSHGLSERDSGRQIEGECRCRELTDSVDRDRSARFDEPRKCIERNRSTASTKIDLPKIVGPLAEARGDFEDDPILIRLRVDDRDLTLAKRIVEDVVDQLRGDAES